MNQQRQIRRQKYLCLGLLIMPLVAQGAYAQTELRVSADLTDGSTRSLEFSLVARINLDATDDAAARSDLGLFSNALDSFSIDLNDPSGGPLAGISVNGSDAQQIVSTGIEGGTLAFLNGSGSFFSALTIETSDLSSAEIVTAGGDFPFPPQLVFDPSFLEINFGTRSPNPSSLPIGIETIQGSSQNSASTVIVSFSGSSRLYTSVGFSIEIVQVPEPTCLTLLGVGLLLVAPRISCGPRNR